jgi:hypothetical protein
MAIRVPWFPVGVDKVGTKISAERQVRPILDFRLNPVA